MSLVYSTFVGGAGRELGQGIAVDAGGNAYVTGVTESFDSPFTSAYEGFPVTSGAFQIKGSYDAFVTKLNSKGSALVYSTYLGGTGVSIADGLLPLMTLAMPASPAIRLRLIFRSAMQSKLRMEAGRWMLL